MEQKEGVGIYINLTPQIPALPDFKDKKQVDIRYSLVEPYANVHIHWNSEISELIYEVEEPVLSDGDKRYLESIEVAMEELININIVVEKDKEAMIKYLDKTAKLIISELNLPITEDSYRKIFYYLFRDFIGFDLVEPLMRDYFIEDIDCNGINTPIYIIHRVYKNMRTSVQFDNMDKLSSFVEKLAQRSGRYVSYANPILDGSLPDGSRVNATYTKDISSRGPTFTIRKFTKIPWTPTQLIDKKTLSPEMMAYLWLLIQYKSNILIAGETASGKTTLLNAIAFFVPPEARVVSIEDTRELNLTRENWLPSVARNALNVGGIGEVDLFSLLKASFRQNPDYVIVGEVRGKEAFVMFQGMASGHSSLSTLHADSVDTVIKRLETPPISLPPTLVNTLDAVCIMSHVVINKKESRRLRSIVEVMNVDLNGIATTNTPSIWNPAQDKFFFKRQSAVFQKISNKQGISMQELYKEFDMRSKLLYALTQKKVFDFNRVQKIITDYYRSPTEILKKYGVVA